MKLAFTENAKSHLAIFNFRINLIKQFALIRNAALEYQFSERNPIFFYLTDEKIITANGRWNPSVNKSKILSPTFSQLLRIFSICPFMKAVSFSVLSLRFAWNLFIAFRKPFKCWKTL